MANRKISDLTALTAPATGDLLPIVELQAVAAALWTPAVIAAYEASKVA